MKTKMTSWIEIECDLSEYPKEVSNYAMDQFEDRIGESCVRDEMEIETNYEKQTLTFTSPMIEIIQHAIEEKQHDIEYERKHGERE